MPQCRNKARPGFRGKAPLFGMRLRESCAFPKRFALKPPQAASTSPPLSLGAAMAATPQGDARRRGRRGQSKKRAFCFAIFRPSREARHDMTLGQFHFEIALAPSGADARREGMRVMHARCRPARQRVFELCGQGRRNRMPERASSKLRDCQVSKVKCSRVGTLYEKTFM